MIFILCEKTITSICSGLDSFYEKFPDSTRIFCTNEFFKNLNTKTYNQPPLLANRWLIVCGVRHVKNNVIALKELAEKNVVIITTDNMEDAMQCEELFLKIQLPVKIIDNRVPEKKDVIAYILSNIQADNEVAEYIYNRYKGYIPNITKSVHTLSLLDNVTKAEVRKYTAPTTERTLHDLANWLIGRQQDFIKYEDVVKIVYNYRFGMSYLLKYLIEYLDTYLAIFEEMSLGNLDATNAQVYLSTCKHRLIKKVSYKRLLVIIDSYSKVSTDKILLIKYHLSEIKPGSFNSYKLINLLKITG